MAIHKSDYSRIFAESFAHVEKLLLNAKQHPDALDQYLESWLDIAEQAAEVDNLALQDVILLFIEACDSVIKKTKGLDNLPDEQWQFFTKWNTLFADYIKAPDDKDNAAALIKCLNDSMLGIGLQPNDEQMLLDSFSAVILQIITATSEPAELKQDDAITAQLSIWEKLTILFQEAELNLQEILATQIGSSAESYAENLRHYLESWNVIANVINTANDEALAKFLDNVLLFIDLSSQIFDQTANGLHKSRQVVLKQWHNLFSHYIKIQGSQQLTVALVKCLTVLATLTEPISVWERLEELVGEAVSNLKAMAAQQGQQNQPAFAKYMHAYKQNWQQIAEIIETERKPAGLLDVVLLFTEISSPAFEQTSLSNQYLARLETWHSLFAIYIKRRGDIQTVSPLLKCLSDPFWSDAISAKDEEMLLADFIVEPKSQSALPPESVVIKSPVASLYEPTAELDKKLANETAEITAALPPTLAPTEETELPAKQTTPVNPELIGMVHDEFSLLVKEFNAEISAVTNPQEFKVALKNHEFKFENLAKACNTIGLLGLEQVFEQLSLNMRSRRDVDTFSEIQAELFKAALPLIQDYIVAITDKDKAVALVAHLSKEGWKQPLTEEQLQPLLDLLSGLVLSTHNLQLDNRKTIAELADVSLELPEDVNRDLLDSLLNELPILTGNFSAVIQQIISGNKNVQQLLEAQRIAHTLKGSGNIVGVTGIAVVTHHLEEILEYLCKHEIFPPKALAEVLLESADCLEMMCDLMLNGEEQPPDQALQVLQNVLNWANQIAATGLPSEETGLEITTLPAQPDTDLTPIIVREPKAVEAVAMTRVPSETIDKLLRMTGESSILGEQFKERIKRFADELKLLNELTWQMQSLVSELDQAINIQSHSAKIGRSSTNSEFDALEMEQYNELHTAASRIAEAATDIRETCIQMDEQLIDLKYFMIEEETIQKENQEMVQSIRMVPANTIASRCQRIVRQACRATNKEVDLEIKGADLLIDSEILNDMVDPLMHLLRNSIDHGIEPAQIREKFNKPPTGKITLEFSRKGNYAVISCKDDGGGLASGNILQTAIKKGLISAKQQLTEAEIHKLILIPGFSTRAVVTQTSGRGIGMDAIQTKISTIQGQMSLISERGKGLTIEITVPLTLSSMLSLLVKCGGQTMAISNRGLRKIYHANECTLEQQEGHLYCDIDYERYPAKYFAELVGMPISYSAEQKFQALRIEDEIGRTHIVFVEELLGYRDLLVKNMGAYIPHIQGISGVSILGNGDVAPVIDLVEMLYRAAKYDYVLADATKALADSIHGLPVALVVDDSLSARRSVAMLLKDSGLEVETAIDGLDAIKHIDKTIPDIILVDLEMPRMNGIELTAHIRGREAMKNTPIIMITSRATEKHRKQAEAAGVTKFMTKPFTEDDLINSVRTLMDNPSA